METLILLISFHLRCFHVFLNTQNDSAFQLKEFLEDGSGSDLISEMEGEDSTYPDDIPMDAAETQTSGRKATRVSTSDVKGMSEFHGGDKLINDIQEIMQLSKKGGLKRYLELPGDEPQMGFNFTLRNYLD